MHPALCKRQDGRPMAENGGRSRRERSIDRRPVQAAKRQISGQKRGRLSLRQWPPDPPRCRCAGPAQIDPGWPFPRFPGGWCTGPASSSGQAGDGIAGPLSGALLPGRTGAGEVAGLRTPTPAELFTCSICPADPSMARPVPLATGRTPEKGGRRVVSIRMDNRRTLLIPKNPKKMKAVSDFS